MIGRILGGALLLGSLTACGSTAADPFNGVRTVFHNPYQAPDAGPVTGREFGWFEGRFYPGKGNVVFDGLGNRREMTHRERRYWKKQREQRAIFVSQAKPVKGGDANGPGAPELSETVPASKPQVEERRERETVTPVRKSKHPY